MALVHTLSGSVLDTGGVTVNKEEKILEVLQFQLLMRANKRKIQLNWVVCFGVMLFSPLFYVIHLYLK